MKKKNVNAIRIQSRTHTYTHAQHIESYYCIMAVLCRTNKCATHKQDIDLMSPVRAKKNHFRSLSRMDDHIRAVDTHSYTRKYTYACSHYDSFCKTHFFRSLNKTLPVIHSLCTAYICVCVFLLTCTRYCTIL